MSPPLRTRSHVVPLSVQAGDAGTHYVGFALDGYFGWVKLQISGDRAGLILKEYYFDFNATSGGGTLG